MPALRRLLVPQASSRSMHSYDTSRPSIPPIALRICRVQRIVLPFLSAFLLSTFLQACGGGGGSGPGTTTSTGGGAGSTGTGTGGNGGAGASIPTATVNQTGATLPSTAPIVVRFSETMDPSSLQLAGTLSSDSNRGTWSQTAFANDTLTLTPKTRWNVGSTGTLSIDAKDLAGNSMATLTASYFVPPKYVTFQAASVVIGQSDFSGIAVGSVYRPYGSAAVTADGTLLIGSTNSSVVLAYGSVPTVNGAFPDFQLGAFGAPQQAVALGTRLAVVDSAWNQVVIYSSIPTSGAANPDVVVGQADLFTVTASCSASGVDQPQAAAATPDGKLIVTDSGNNRILIWNSWPTSNATPADIVLGQADFTHCVGNDDNQDRNPDAAPSARTLSYPAGVWTDGRRLIALDVNNNRALIWNSFPVSNFQPADLVLGQSNFTRASANDDNQDGTSDSTPSARTLRSPYNGVASSGVQLAIADYGNNRVLIWNTFPTINFQPADVVLGQGDFSHQVANDDNQDALQDGVASARTLNGPAGVLFYRDKLLVTDGVNSRVLVFNSQ